MNPNHMSDRPGFLEEVLGGLNYYTAGLREDIRGLFTILAHQKEFSVLYTKLKWLRKGLSSNELIDLSLYHIQNRTGFYKKTLDQKL